MNVIRVNARMGTDVEKVQISSSLRSAPQSDAEDRLSESGPGSGSSSTNENKVSRYQQWAASIKGLETRGIEPVPVEERHMGSGSASLKMMLMWLSMGMSMNNVIAGSLGTLAFRLSFLDAALCAVCGNVLGCLAVGYISTWGPRSGNRTLVWLSHVLMFPHSAGVPLPLQVLHCFSGRV